MPPTTKTTEEPAVPVSAPAASPARARFAAQHAWALIGHQRWFAACDALEGYDESRFDVGLSARLARNMAALQKHRPNVYQTLMAAGPVAATHRFRLAHSPTGVTILEQKNRYSQYVPITRSDDPHESSRQTLGKLRPLWKKGEPLVVAGIGCGAFPNHLAQNPPPLKAGRQQAIHLIERDPLRVLAVLMLLDWSGESAPIQDKRFFWYIGRDALAHFEATLANDPLLPLPTATIGKPRMRQRADAIVAEVRRHSQAADNGHADRNRAYYQSFACDALTRGTQRRPRVLIVESREHVLAQRTTHDISDIQDGFARLGWTAQTLQEPCAWHRLTKAALRATIDQFKPDVVFASGFTRDTHRRVFPDNLPVIHHLPDPSDLANLPAGHRDFALTPRLEGPTPLAPAVRKNKPNDASSLKPRAEERSDEAPDRSALITLDRRIFETPPLTRTPARPEVWANVGRDLACISDASANPKKLLRNLRHDPLLASVGQDMIERYSHGQSLPTPGSLAQLVDQHAKTLGRELNADDRRDAICRLWHPLNDTLYQQQALRWISESVQEFELTLAIHGDGWADHPDFAQFAARPINHRPQHDQIHRDSKINLHLAPSFCLNQQTLDGLVAGGFFLFREHPTDTALSSLLDMLPAEAQNTKQALGTASGVTRPLLREVLDEARMLCDACSPEDPVAWLQACRRSELVTPGQTQPLPQYDETAFHDAHSLRSKLQRFIIDQPARHMIAEAHRKSVEHRLSYTAGLRRVLKRIGRSIADEAPASLAA